MKSLKFASLLTILSLVSVLQSSVFALDRTARLGLGMSNQLLGDYPAISFKLQKSKTFAFGGLLSYNNRSLGGWGAGLKIYRNIFDEPQLNFYTSLLGALINEKISETESESGFQFDLTLGSEFSFANLNSIGMSFEFGLSLNKLEDDFILEVANHSFVVAGIHFYL